MLLVNNWTWTKWKSGHTWGSYYKCELTGFANISKYIQNNLMKFKLSNDTGQDCWINMLWWGNKNNNLEELCLIQSIKGFRKLQGQSLTIWVLIDECPQTFNCLVSHYVWPLRKGFVAQCNVATNTWTFLYNTVVKKHFMNKRKTKNSST